MLKTLLGNLEDPFKSKVTKIMSMSDTADYKVILFGSVARQEHNFLSDIDIYLVFPDSYTVKQRVDICDSLQDDLTRPHVNVMYGIEKNYRESDSLFVQGLKRDGIFLN